MNRGWKTFEKHVGNRLHYHEWTFKVNPGESYNRKEESCRESFNLLREHVSFPQQNVGKNMYSKTHSDEVSERKEEDIIGQWRKGNPCSKFAKNLAELFRFQCFVGGRILQVRTLNISLKPFLSSVEDMAWLLLPIYRKMREERNDLKIELNKKRKQNLKI